VQSTHCRRVLQARSAQRFTICGQRANVIIYWDGETTTSDGKPYRNSYVWIFKMRDGRAAQVTEFLDLVAYDDVVQ